MAVSGPAPPGRLDPGGIIKAGIAIILREPGLLFGLAIVAIFAATAVELLARALFGPGTFTHLLTVVVQAAGSSAAIVAVTRAVLARADNRDISFGQAYQALGSSAFRVFGTSLVLSIGIAIGMLLFIVPGIWLATIWIVAVPAAIVEDMGPVSAARRSSQLTRGNRWQAFLLILLSVLVGLALSVAISLLIGLPVGLLVGPEAVQTDDGTTRFGQVLEAVGIVIQSVLSSTFAALAWRRLHQIWATVPMPA